MGWFSIQIKNVHFLLKVLNSRLYLVLNGQGHKAYFQDKYCGI